eukprot:scaffold330_cov246-Pinguiococcus_pyrenoidosus.AAC.18
MHNGFWREHATEDSLVEILTIYFHDNDLERYGNDPVSRSGVSSSELNTPGLPEAVVEPPEAQVAKLKASKGLDQFRRLRKSVREGRFEQGEDVTGGLVYLSRMIQADFGLENGKPETEEEGNNPRDSTRMSSGSVADDRLPPITRSISKRATAKTPRGLKTPKGMRGRQNSFGGLSQDNRLVVQCAESLFQLSKRPGIAMEVVEDGGVAALIRLSQCDDARITDIVAATLYNLVCEDECLPLLMQHDAAALLLDLSFRKGDQSRDTCSHVYAHLSTYHHVFDSILTETVLHSLTLMIQQGNVSTKRNCIQAIVNFCGLSPSSHVFNNKIEYVLSACVSGVEMLSSQVERLDLQEFCCEVLLSFTILTLTRTKIIDEDILPILARLAANARLGLLNPIDNDNGEGRKRMIRRIAIAVYNLSSIRANHKEILKEGGKDGGLRDILHIALDLNEEETTERVCTIVMTISCSNDEKLLAKLFPIVVPRFVPVPANALPGMEDALEDSGSDAKFSPQDSSFNEQAKRLVAMTIRNLSMFDRNRESLATRRIQRFLIDGVLDKDKDTCQHSTGGSRSDNSSHTSSWSKDPSEVQHLCLEALASTLTLSSTHRMLETTELVAALHEAVDTSNGDAKTQELCALVFFHMSRVPEVWMKHLDGHLLPCLVALASEEQAPRQVLRLCIGALYSFSFLDGAQAAFVRADALRAVSRIYDSPASSQKELSSMDEESVEDDKKADKKADKADKAPMPIKSFEDVLAQAQASAIIANVTKTDAGARSIAAADFVACLTELALQPGTPGLTRRAAVIVLKAKGAISLMDGDQMGVRDAAVSLAKIMSLDPDRRVVAACARAFVMYSSSDAGSQALVSLTNAGEAAWLPQIFNRFMCASGAETQACGTAAFCNLTSRHEAWLVGDATIEELVVTTLLRMSISLKETAAKSLHNLLSYPHRRLDMLRSGVLYSLFRLARSESIRIRLLALEAAYNLSFHAECHSLLVHGNVVRSIAEILRFRDKQVSEVFARSPRVRLWIAGACRNLSVPSETHARLVKDRILEVVGRMLPDAAQEYGRRASGLFVASLNLRNTSKPTGLNKMGNTRSNVGGSILEVLDNPIPSVTDALERGSPLSSAEEDASSLVEAAAAARRDFHRGVDKMVAEDESGDAAEIKRRHREADAALVHTVHNISFEGVAVRTLSSHTGIVHVGFLVNFIAMARVGLVNSLDVGAVTNAAVALANLTADAKAADEVFVALVEPISELLETLVFELPEAELYVVMSIRNMLSSALLATALLEAGIMRAISMRLDRAKHNATAKEIWAEGDADEQGDTLPIGRRLRCVYAQIIQTLSHYAADSAGHEDPDAKMLGSLQTNRISEEEDGVKDLVFSGVVESLGILTSVGESPLTQSNAFLGTAALSCLLNLLSTTEGDSITKMLETGVIGVLQNVIDLVLKCPAAEGAVVGMTAEDADERGLRANMRMLVPLVLRNVLCPLESRSFLRQSLSRRAVVRKKEEQQMIRGALGIVDDILNCEIADPSLSIGQNCGAALHILCTVARPQFLEHNGIALLTQLGDVARDLETQLMCTTALSMIRSEEIATAESVPHVTAILSRLMDYCEEDKIAASALANQTAPLPTMAALHPKVLEPPLPQKSQQSFCLAQESTVRDVRDEQKDHIVWERVTVPVPTFGDEILEREIPDAMPIVMKLPDQGDFMRLSTRVRFEPIKREVTKIAKLPH